VAEIKNVKTFPIYGLLNVKICHTILKIIIFSDNHFKILTKSHSITSVLLSLQVVFYFVESPVTLVLQVPVFGYRILDAVGYQ